MKITFPALLAIVGLLTQSQSIAIGQEQESRAQNRESLAPQGAHTTEPAASIEAQRTDNSVSAEGVALDEVRNAVQADPVNAPGIVAHSIKTDVPHPIPMSCEIVRTTIRALGKNATRILVARIVYAAVSARPSETLDIVCVAIRDTPGTFHRDITHAAIAAVPDPNASVSQTDPEHEPCSCPSRAELYEGITLSEAIYEEALLAGATAYELDYYPALATNGIANDNPINKDPPPTPPPNHPATPPPTPPPPPPPPPPPTPPPVSP